MGYQCQTAFCYCIYGKMMEWLHLWSSFNNNKDVQALTELTALSYEARPAGALSADVLAVRPVLTAAHFSTLRAVETCRTAWKGTHNNSRSYSDQCIRCQTEDTIHLSSSAGRWSMNLEICLRASFLWLDNLFRHNGSSLQLWTNPVCNYWRNPSGCL